MLVEIEKQEKIITLKERRSHLKLSLAGRRRQLSKQADKLIKHYKTGRQEREVWQGGDIIEL